MRKIIILALTVFAPALFAHTIQLSRPGDSSVVMDLQALKLLPQTTYTTSLPWLKKASEFTGVELSTLLKHAYGDVPEKVQIRALNDYHSTLSRADILRYQPIIAYQQNQQYMKVRHKGPYWLIYPLAKYPEIDVSQYHSQMVWQINRISIKEE